MSGSGRARREKARVLRSSDHGRSGTIAETPLLSGAKSGIYSIAFRDNRNGVVVGGTYDKEPEALDNCAVTSDGGATWTLIKDHGLSGFRSVVMYLPGPPGSLLAIGPSGSDVSADDGRTWTPLPGPGFHTFSLAPKARNRMGRRLAGPNREARRPHGFWNSASVSLLNRMINA